MNTWIATAYGLAMTAFRHGLQPRDTRHCEERSDVAVYEYMDCFAALAMTAL